MARPLLAVLCVLLAACTGSDPAPPTPVVEETTQIAPGPGLPAAYDAVGGNSNNNLDVVRHDGLIFFASRKAPNHFASPDTHMFVFSSTDEQSWTLEDEIALGTDVREPRFLSINGRLFLYFAKLGMSSGAFEPAGMLMTERLGPGQWTTPAPFYDPDGKWIPWRVIPGPGAVPTEAWMSTYRDGQREYDFSGLPMLLALLHTTDGVTWTPVDPSRPGVDSGGGSETGVTFDAAGDLYAVQRNEPGDTTGWGAKICKAGKGSLGDWHCTHDPKKYDSPLLFTFDDKVYLIGRRNVSDTGNYELDPGVKWSVSEELANLTDYWVRPKRCSIWQVDRAKLEVRYLVDIPGWGDTCFASILDVPGDPRRKIVYNYSSPLDNPANADIGWMTGQEGETRIYRTIVYFPPALTR